MIKKFCVSILFALLVEEIFLQVDAACSQDECMKKGTHFCQCGMPGNSTKYSVPPGKTCKDIGCADGGQYCYCDDKGGKCNFQDRTPPCDQTKCANDKSKQCCYCWVDKSEPVKYPLPANNDCREHLKSIGYNNGNNFCAQSVCSCDEYSQCTCKPPKARVSKQAFRGFTPEATKCAQENCNTNTYEYCQCTCDKCKDNNVILVNKTSSHCDGMMKSPYVCTNAGKKCNCLPDGACNCVDVDKCSPIKADDCDKCSKLSNKACICYAKGYRIKIPSRVKNCSSLVSKNKGETPLDSCPYQIGVDCKCEYNTNKKMNQCYSRKVNPFQQIWAIDSFPNPNTPCSGDEDCTSKFYCVCTNSIDRTYIVEHPLKPEEDSTKICNMKYSQPPNLVCRPFGNKADCKGGRCCYTDINLYNDVDDL